MHKHWRISECKGLKREYTEMCISLMWGICGKVIIEPMKYHTMLKALSNIQAQRKHLRIYAKIEKLEQGKLEILRISVLWSIKIYKFARY